MYICTYVYMYVYMYVCIYVCIMYICIYTPCLVLVEHSVVSNTSNSRTSPLAVHSRHVATKPLW